MRRCNITAKFHTLRNGFCVCSYHAHAPHVPKGETLHTIEKRGALRCDVVVETRGEFMTRHGLRRDMGTPGNTPA